MENIYGIYDKGELIFKGNAKEVGKKFYMDKANVYNRYYLDGKLDGKYDIVLLGKVSTKKTQLKEPKMTKYEKELDYIIRHFKIYGNVYFPRYPEPKLIEDLRKAGYEIKVDCYKLDKKKVDYILTAR